MELILHRIHILAAAFSVSVIPCPSVTSYPGAGFPFVLQASIILGIPVPNRSTNLVLLKPFEDNGLRCHDL